MQNLNLDKLTEKTTDELMRTAYLDYAMSVITSRALPDVRDGLKPVHRRILFAMQQAGNFAGKAYRKSARTVGDVIGKYHPHGDVSVYDAAVRMAQPFSLRIPVIDGQGNFGSIDADSPAAMRYTEMRLSRVATETFFQELKKNTVAWRSNYDGSEQEPSVLPIAYPNLLVNGVNGIAVAMASDIPPHNMREVIGVTKVLMQNPQAELSELLKIMPGPDFPTGGIGFDRDGFVSAFETGRGRVSLRAKWHVEQRQRGEAIVIDEIPFQVIKAVVVEKISELVKEKKILDISDIRDESNKEGVRIWIALKSGAVPELVMSQIFAKTKLEERFHYNCVALEGGTRPRRMSIREMILAWIAFRRDVVKKRYIFDREQANARLHIIKGLIAAIDRLDDTIAAIRSAQDRAVAKSAIMELLNIDSAQADAILELRLQKLTGLEINELRQEMQDIIAHIAELTAIIESPERMDAIISEELNVIANRFGDDRRTELDDSISRTTTEDLVLEEDVVLMMTRRGYVKRIAAASMRRQNRGTRGKRAMDIEDGDELSLMEACSSKDSLIVLTNSGQAYALKAYQIPEVGGKGKHIRNLIDGLDEVIVASVVASAKDDTQSLIIATMGGVVKRTALTEYRSTGRKGGVIGITLEEGDKIVSAATAKAGQDVVLVAQSNKAIRFEVEDVREVGRSGKGVIGIRNGDGLIAMLVINRDSTDDLLVLTENGFGKRTPLSEFRGQERGGQGVCAFKEMDKTGALVAALTVNANDDVVAVTSNGVSNRVHSQDIRSTGRNATGVKVIKLDEGAKVVLASKSEKYEEEPEKTEATEETSVSEG